VFARIQVLFAILQFSQVLLLAQEVPKSDSLRQRMDVDLEDLLEQTTQDAEESELLDLLSDLQENPLDVNVASEADFQQLPGVTPILAHNLVLFRSTRLFKNVDDLLGVEGVSSDLLDQIRPFLRVGEGESTGGGTRLAAVSFRTRSIENLQQRRGFRDGTYPGSPLKLYNRLLARVEEGAPDLSRLHSERWAPMRSSLQVGLVTEKDAGEKNVADFASGHIAVALPALSTRLVVGDFTVESAEGLVFWRSVGLSKGAEVIAPVRKNGIGIRPYSSTDENGYFRGAAGEVSLGWFGVAVMYSNKSVSATVDSNGVVTAFDNSGLHRTDTELSKKSQLRERTVGVRLSALPIEGLKLGVSAYQSRFTRPVRFSTLSSLPNDIAAVVGFDAAYTQDRFSAFSEIARDRNNAIAGLAGIVLKPHQTVDVACLLRSYPRDFLSPHSSSFGESGSPMKNESGAYLGISVRAISWMKLAAYFDQFAFPWRTWTNRLPSTGHDFFASTELKVSRKVSVNLQFKHKNKSDESAVQDELGRADRTIEPRVQRNYRATIELNSSRNFRWRSRIEIVGVHYRSTGGKEKGTLMFQDIRWSPVSGVQIDARVAAFQTDSYDSRLYEYESEPFGAVSNPALFGKGLRWYLLTRYEIAGGISLWIKYARTQKEGVKSMGSGEDEIQGDVDNRLTFQLEIRL
jgi:hypothetical protein